MWYTVSYLSPISPIRTEHPVDRCCEHRCVLRRQGVEKPGPPGYGPIVLNLNAHSEEI